MRVAYSFPHLIGAPGIGTTAWHQAAQLAAAGLEVTLYAPDGGDVPPGVLHVRTLPRAISRALSRTLARDGAMRAHDHAAAVHLARAATRPEIVHTWPVAGMHTLRAARRLGVLGVRELPNTHVEHGYRVARTEAEAVGVALPVQDPHRERPRRLRVELAEYAAADLLLAPSDVVRGTFLARGFPHTRVVRHRYGFDPIAFPEPSVHDSALRDGPLRVLFVGRVEPRKGLHHALRAWQASSLPSTGGTFTVAGRCDAGYVTALGPLAALPGVHFAGFVTDPARLYAEHDVMVLPSVEEGSALVTYEAMASACLPLVSDASGAPTGTGGPVLVHPAGNWRALARDLDHVAEHRAELARRQRACAGLRRELSWRAGVQETITAYTNALDHRRTQEP